MKAILVTRCNCTKVIEVERPQREIHIMLKPVIHPLRWPNASPGGEVQQERVFQLTHVGNDELVYEEV
jgi:hypothetical protein